MITITMLTINSIYTDEISYQFKPLVEQTDGNTIISSINKYLSQFDTSMLPIIIQFYINMNPI